MYFLWAVSVWVGVSFWGYGVNFGWGVGCGSSSRGISLLSFLECKQWEEL